MGRCGNAAEGFYGQVREPFPLFIHKGNPTEVYGVGKAGGVLGILYRGHQDGPGLGEHIFQDRGLGRWDGIAEIPRGNIPVENPVGELGLAGDAAFQGTIRSLVLQQPGLQFKNEGFLAVEFKQELGAGGGRTAKLHGGRFEIDGFDL